MTGYRSDIDGLRALAVISVVVFHFSSMWLPGGFIGVDIFFVISGYLITGNIYRDVVSGRFSFFDFYSRRIRRIVPAATLVILVVLFLGQFILLPEDLIGMSLSAVASQLSAANVYFTYFFNSSYFAQDAELQPLLHFWSLGVEEQFYFLWPLLLLFMVKRLTVVFILIFSFLIAFLSFYFAQLTLFSDPMFSYYMLPTRAGQLLVGAMCFFITYSFLKGEVISSFYRFGLIASAFSWAGFLGIFYSLFFLSKSHYYPGYNSIIPTVSSGMIILFSPYGSLGKLLSLRVLVFVGLISYSMYLWHWPILSYFRYLNLKLDWYWFFPFISSLILISYLSWRYVEQVFRSRRYSFRKILLKQYVLPSFFVISISSFFVVTQGEGFVKKNRLDDGLGNSIFQPAHRDKRVCQDFRVTDQMINHTECLVNGGHRVEALLWGDSNAAHFVPMLAELSEAYGFSFRNVAHSSCPPLLNGAENFISERRMIDCLDSIEVVESAISSYDLVILSAAWGLYYSNNSEQFEGYVRETLESLVSMGKRVVIIGRITAFPELDPICFHKQMKFPFMDCDYSKSFSFGVDELSYKANMVLSSIASEYVKVHYVDFNNLICNQNECSAFINNQMLYFDSTHLTIGGSRILGLEAVSKNAYAELFDKVLLD